MVTALEANVIATDANKNNVPESILLYANETIINAAKNGSFMTDIPVAKEEYAHGLLRHLKRFGFSARITSAEKTFITVWW